MFLPILKSLGIHHFFRWFIKENLTILCLHQISNFDNSFFPPITPEKFEKLLIYLTKYYNIIHFNEISDNNNENKPNIILSFDDGYYDFIEYALPILRKYNVKSNHNIVNQSVNTNEVIWSQKLNLFFENFKKESSINPICSSLEKILNIKITKCYNWFDLYHKIFLLLLKTEKNERDSILNSFNTITLIDLKSIKMMNWNDLKICLSENVEIGSHTYTHDSLITINDFDKLNFEINNSIKEINQKLDIKCNILSLPNGQYNENVVNYLKQLNLKYILTVNDSINHINNFYDRIYMIQENTSSMQTRVELIPQTLRKWKNIISRK